MVEHVCLVDDQHRGPAPFGCLAGQDAPGLDGERGGAVDGLAAERRDYVGEYPPYPGGGVADVDDGVAGGVEVGDGGADRDRLAGTHFARDHRDGLLADRPGDAGGGLAAVARAPDRDRRAPPTAAPGSAPSSQPSRPASRADASQRPTWASSWGSPAAASDSSPMSS